MIQIPKIIFGTFQYCNQEELNPIITAAYKNGIVGFDTSPSYNTENILGVSLNRLIIQEKLQRHNLFIQDKIDGWQMETSKGHIEKYVENSIAALNCNYIDVLFVHWPFPNYLKETWITFSKLKQSGIIKYIGLSNVRERHVKSLISETGIVPDVVQIERHPLRTCLKDIEYFHSNNILVEAYSPVCRMDKRLLNSDILNSISKKYNKSIGQVILRWHIDTNVVPVFMTKKISRINENMNIFDFSLTKDEILSINNLNINYKIFVESVCCPGI